MKVAKLVGDRFKERPADCEIDSHALMLRGGYMRYVANGIYSLYTPLRRITRKIEQIIREEMDAIDGQEVLFPVVLPASLWEESGRYASVGSELLRFKDRNSIPLVFGMTHEEAAVQLVREYGQSYAKYPFMVYQIQTKFRDEARPRGGLIRAREFMMKDGYSFHTSQEDLQQYYYRCLHAYEKIFARTGIPEVISVASDSGMMGGNVSHEFILLTDVGEDSIAVCSECDYRANMEAAESIVQNEASEASKEIALVHTPDIHTIEDLSGFLNIPEEKSCKAVVYQKNSTDEYVVLFIRGDLDANETKLKNYLGEDIRPADITDGCGLNAGFIGPYNLKGDFIVLFDKSLKGSNNLACGGNIPDHHYTGLQLERDCGAIEYHDFAKIKAGGICPKCGKHTISISRGIEVGNIFQLGTKYSQAMNMQYLDKDGSSKYPVMGCYGIGIGRLAASVCEAHHDAYGPIWPMSIAPWQVHLCCIRSDNPEAKKSADELYEKLQSLNVEVIYDDRSVSTGVMFSDADLLGVPVRVIVSPRNMKENCLEITTRDKKISMKVSLDKAVEAITSLVSELTDEACSAK
ncbi:proline--tRNA ligase [Lutispora saccharofermentans]|uniref:Proline--tRNA ligase n=1 Tax=Lutispora saccharofermentans TaxID=3024236 RepID=A0ABT1NFE4_9FIRM|nr:proline--tRNA ligase [Lutispora saccharofermentans]MCQ1529309.1 proline--tRNA ligase [Lutispora saccharofermentans]